MHRSKSLAEISRYTVKYLSNSLYEFEKENQHNNPCVVCGHQKYVGKSFLYIRPPHDCQHYVSNYRNRYGCKKERSSYLVGHHR